MEIDAIALMVNIILLSLIIGGTILLIWRLKLGSKNKVLLFVLFILYWMAPLMCREYTGQMHIHQPNYDGGTLLWVPLAVYGFAGLLWRPLTDLITYKMKSRKNLIFISLSIQLLTLWPMFVWPESFAVNIIQSIGTGVGASGIGLFNLMFSEQEHKRKIFTTVSILALPALIAEFITSAIEAIVCGCVPEHGISGEADNPTVYLYYLKYLWLIAIVFIIASFIITGFIKENKKQLFTHLGSKEVIQNKHDGWGLTLLCFAGMCFIFTRWVTAGPSSVTQLIYISVGPRDMASNAWLPSYILEEVKYFEGYLSLMFALGQLVGAIIAALILSKHENNAKWIIVLGGYIVSAVYLLANTLVISPHLFFWSNILNGIGFGLVYPVLIGVVLNKHFRRVKVITPIGIFNTALALGIVGATLFNNILKGPIYDFHYSVETSPLSAFDQINVLVNYVTMGVAALMVVSFGAAFGIWKKYPPKQSYLGYKFSTASEMEI